MLRPAIPRNTGLDSMAQPITVRVGNLSNADADGISASQIASGAQPLVLNGALTNGQTANNVAQSQSPGSASDLTLNGTLASGGVAYLYGRKIYITSVGDDSGVTFTITGQSYGPIGGPFAVTETITGANASVVSSVNSYYTISKIHISGASAAAVTVGAGGLAVLDHARRVIITSTGDETGITFTISGTDASGYPISEVVAGKAIAAASSVLDYKTVSSVVTSGATTNTVTVGTNGVAASPWVRFDDYAANAQIAVQATVTGTVNYTVQQTMQDPNDSANPVAPANIVWLDSPDTSNLVGQTATKFGTYPIAPIFARVLLNSGTGSVSTVFRQVYLA